MRRLTRRRPCCPRCPQGPVLDTPQWVRELEGYIIAAQPQVAAPGLLELLFRFATQPVPSALKAALFGAVSAFATDAQSAAQIWDFVKSADVVSGLRRHAAHQDAADPYGGYGQPPAPAAAALGLGGGGALGPKFDLAYQLQEIESGMQSYAETTAFITLVNTLLELCIPAGVGPAAAGGLEMLPVFHFVRDTVYLQLNRRAASTCDCNAAHPPLPCRLWRSPHHCLASHSLALSNVL